MRSRLLELEGTMGGADGRLGSDIELGAAGGYLSIPAEGRGSGVVVIQEWWGLVDHVRDVCDRLARAGFVALSPDLYRGEATSDPGEAQRLMMDLDLPRAEGDLDQAIEALLNHDAVEGARVGCVGFCMGGQLALHAATRNRRIGAVVDCYGIHPNVTLDLSAMEASVLGVFAENDDFVTAEAVVKLEAELESAGVRTHFKTYRRVEHAFLNDSRPDVYNATAAREAWVDILGFLQAELG
jgi:carboxymethylenebutenolidase